MHARMSGSARLPRTLPLRQMGAHTIQAPYHFCTHLRDTLHSTARAYFPRLSRFRLRPVDILLYPIRSVLEELIPANIHRAAAVGGIALAKTNITCSLPTEIAIGIGV